MVRRVLSLIRGSDAGAARQADPALDLNAFAVADEVDLTLVLKDHGVELALATTRADVGSIAGVDVPVAEPSTDLRGLLASGARVCVVAEDLEARGLTDRDLIDGIEVIGEPTLAQLITDNDVTLSTSS
jgi:predicted peroxiredoxin